jgi:hypothetical protein
MKNRFTLKNAIPRSAGFGLALGGLLLLAVAASSSAEEVLPPSSLPYGLSYEEWSAKWCQWNFGLDTNHEEFVGWPGICEGPGSRVRFLLGAPGPITATRKISIGDKTPLFFPILSTTDDNTACPVSDFTSYTADQLAAVAAGNWTAVSETDCTIDGVAVAGLESPATTEYLIQTPAFSYTTAQHGGALGVIEGEYCIPGGTTIYPAVADGVWLMLSPFSPGKHTIHLVAVVGPVAAPYFTQDITYEITVCRE